MQDVELDALIVGAGPVGLFLANECARRGLQSRIVEARPAQSEHSKALAIFPRTLEVFDMAGLVDPFLEAANRVTRVAVISRGRRLGGIPFTMDDSPYPFIAMVPQNVTEQVLVDRLRQRGGDVEYETSLISAVQHDDHVSATLERGGKRVEVRARFLVGCDGAHSAVRHLLQLSFEGAQYEASFLLADVQTNDAIPADELQLCPSPDGPLAIFPMSAARRRIVATVDRPEGEVPSLDLVKRILRERGPKGFEAHGMLWSSYFRIHHRQASALRVNRMFIAGDAAHIHSPFGGQGMNTGLQDAWNLVWKLDFAARGLAQDRLLDSYTAERRPVIREVIGLTHFLTRAMGTPRALAQTLRDTMIPIVSRLPPFQRRFVRTLSELGVAYGGSPIVEGPGTRYFEESMRGGTGIGSRFLLMVDEGTPSIRTAATQFCQAQRDVVEWRSSRQAGLMLVRPDGYVAGASNGSDGPSAIAAVRTVLERQARLAS
jgi:2-polyprenyl-6-methoxyphenol hydroxylase-like FAD-dependent oxidoreductase